MSGGTSPLPETPTRLAATRAQPRGFPTRRRLGHGWLAARLGQSLPIAAVMALVLCLIAGLVVDLGATFEQRRGLINQAERAARAGASEIDEVALYQTNLVTLDPIKAQATAAVWLAPDGGLVEVVASTPGGPLDTVRVSLTRSVPTTFMRLGGFASIPISARVSARLEVQP